MATYAIGDIHGCRAELDALLERLRFDANVDHLWFVGDLVNRGPDSLGVLRRVHALRNCATVVLGNHDLHLLATAAGTRAARRRDTFDDVLAAPDRDTLLGWLARQPLLHYDAAIDTAMVHAGLPPAWNFDRAQRAAREIENVLRNDDLAQALERLYGNEPARWRDNLPHAARQRYALNAFTRMRFVDERDGAMDFEHSGPPGTQARGLVPWYRAPERVKQPRIVFGHWAALRTRETPANSAHVLATDTACIWGGLLSAVRLEDEQWFSAPSQQ